MPVAQRARIEKVFSPMKQLVAAALGLFLSLGCARTHAGAPRAAMADPYLDLTVTYSIYAKTLWHDDPAGAGGFWGDGLAPKADKNGNGNVRGMVNTMLGYAMLVHARDNNSLDPKLASLLQQAGLSREELLKYIKLNLN